MLGLNSRIATFQVQRAINQYAPEPLVAILPGVALSELWGMICVGKYATASIWINFCSLSLGVSAMLLASIRERRRKYNTAYYWCATLVLFLLIQLEALMITLFSCILGAGH